MLWENQSPLKWPIREINKQISYALSVAKLKRKALKPMIEQLRVNQADWHQSITSIPIGEGFKGGQLKTLHFVHCFTHDSGDPKIFLFLL